MHVHDGKEDNIHSSNIQGKVHDTRTFQNSSVACEEPYCIHLHKQISHGHICTDAIPLIAVLAAGTSGPKLTSPPFTPPLDPPPGPVGRSPDA